VEVIGAMVSPKISTERLAEAGFVLEVKNPATSRRLNRLVNFKLIFMK
jgi:hypothetical protein